MEMFASLKVWKAPMIDVTTTLTCNHRCSHQDGCHGDGCQANCHLVASGDFFLIATDLP